MTYKDIMDGIEAGAIAIDSCGHCTNDCREYIIERYHDCVDDSNGAGDGTWTGSASAKKTPEEWDVEMRKHFKQMLGWDHGIGEVIWDLPEMYCFHCGRNLKWIFNGDRISLQVYWEKERIIIEKCDMEVSKPTTGIITVKSSLVFCNFFAVEDCIEEDKYTRPWSLNCEKGRENITQYKATHQNIAYGQMGNMSVGIYVNKDGNSIIIGDPYIADFKLDAMTEEEYDANENRYEEFSVIDGHKLVGRVSCEVWRWEAGDKEMLGDLYDKAIERHRRDYVIDVTCVPGQWKFEHYYDTETSSDERIYAKLWNI